MLSTKQIITLTSLLTLSLSSPIDITARQANTYDPDPSTEPYFTVTDFTFSRSDSSSRYSLTLSFPKDIMVANTPPEWPVWVIPGFKDAVPCTGTYFFAGDDENTTSHITPINACGAPNDPHKSVTTKLDVITGDLYLTYTYGSGSGASKYTGLKKGLQPVTQEDKQSFDSPALTGPGIGDEY